MEPEKEKGQSIYDRWENDGLADSITFEDDD